MREGKRRKESSPGILMSPQWVQAGRENPRGGVLGAPGGGMEKEADTTCLPQKSSRDGGREGACLPVVFQRNPTAPSALSWFLVGMS